MVYFDVGERVIFRADDGSKHRGTVTAVLPKLRRIVTDSNKRRKVPVRRLKKSPDRVLILEGRLDRSLRSSRDYGPMLKQWLSAYDVEALYEKVHTLEDIRRFLKKEGRDVSTRIIHIICHGKGLTRRGTAKLCLTFDDIDLSKNLNIFGGLKGKILIFSCCEIGNNENAMLALKKASNAAAVIGYRLLVKDSYTNLAEVLLYDRLLSMQTKLSDAVNQVQETLRILKPAVGDDRVKYVKNPVLVCF